MWLTRTGHEDPFDFRRAAWVDALHRWFDHWLQGIDNGIMEEPRVDVEVAKDRWETAPDWPIPGTHEIDVYLQGTAPGSAGAVGLSSGGATDTLSWTDAEQNETTMISDPTGSQANRLVFLPAPLRKPLRTSGTPIVDIQASLNATQSNLGAVLVDYGPSTQITRSSDGIVDASPVVRTCWGESSANDSACYKEVEKPTVDVTRWRVSKGILDSSNRESLLPVAATPVAIGTRYRFAWPTFPNDFVFEAGHRIGIILVANYRSFSSIPGTTGSTVTLDTLASKVRLPIVGGYGAAVASGGFARDR
jgi:X-Pro dipeptidyl-peptidase